MLLKLQVCSEVYGQLIFNDNVLFIKRCIDILLVYFFQPWATIIDITRYNYCTAGLTMLSSHVTFACATLLFTTKYNNSEFAWYFHKYAEANYFVPQYCALWDLHTPSHMTLIGQKGYKQDLTKNGINIYHHLIWILMVGINCPSIIEWK